MQQKLKIGVFGVWRGLAFIKALQKIDEADVTAICDRDEGKVREALKFCPSGVKVCADFDELIHSGIDAVVLGNYFDEHAPFAVRAMQAGVDVFSETTPAFTLKECVELVEAVEQTGRTYALAENYPFMLFNQEMKKVYGIVLEAQLAGIAATKAGVTGQTIDGAARKVIRDAGYGAYFGHGYGHSLGLEIHESPNCNTRNDKPMPLGAVASAEPGIYLPGKFGVRIEDVVIFTEDGCIDIAKSEKSLIVLPV